MHKNEQTIVDKYVRYRLRVSAYIVYLQEAG